MKHHRSFGVVTLVAGTVVLGGGQILFAMDAGPELGQPMFAASVSEPHGHEARGYLGVETRDVSEDQVGVLKLKDVRGAEITTLDHDGPACKAGMQMHDVILQMNGQTIEGEEQLRRMLREVPVGRTVSFVISRDGQTMTMTMTTADRRMVGLQAWEQHYTVSAPGGSGLVRGNSFIDTKTAANVSAPKEHKDLLGAEAIGLSV